MKTAIVIGSSIAGLLTARVLSKHFQSVTLVERDKVEDQPIARKGQPHTRHLHGLLVHGLQTLCEYFPDLLDGLRSSGNEELDMGLSMRWFCNGNYRTRFEFGWKSLSTSRPFLEWQIRRRVLSLPQIRLVDEHSVLKLLATGDSRRITGVELAKRESKDKAQALFADLIVDASGRGSLTPRWLQALGYAKPEESTVTCGAGYTTRLYERNAQDPNGKEWVFITPEAPNEYRAGGAFPIENNRWIVSLGGWHGNHAPADEAGFMAYAKSLPAPDVYDIIKRSLPASDIVVHKFPASQRRHYEKLRNFPEGYLVLGDAVCSFNPLYGQGMTAAILQAKELDRLLENRRGNLVGLYKPYFTSIARIIDIPWRTAVGEDFRFPETKGKKAPGTDLINAYVAKVHRATHHDPIVGNMFLRVMNLMAPPTSLFHPQILWRVFRQ